MKDALDRLAAVQRRSLSSYVGDILKSHVKATEGG
jgi:hypothetical protein